MSATQLIGARRLQELLARHGINPKRSLGQNFVIEPNTIRRIVELAGVQRDEVVLEIGAGVGSLTLGLSAAAAKVVAVEFDAALVPLLREVLAGVGNVDLVEADALQFDYAASGAGKLVANLPYSIAATVTVKVLAEAP